MKPRLLLFIALALAWLVPAAITRAQTPGPSAATPAAAPAAQARTTTTYTLSNGM